MSSLFKLSVKGIRAFEPEQEETIQFGFPLTLICGQNGSGKTTIIECLKYATTGDLPPNSKGGAFVNDPSLAGRTNVIGQVKLAFRNANGKSMITTRTIQLTRKKSSKAGTMTNTFKTLEGQLVIIDKGNRISISSKNAELDTQTPIYLGASRAILDYVIFCHQDDSLWPLSEASVLKKRFDDIFEASKFTKVLENLKGIKKDMSVDIKLIEQSVKHLKIDKERAKKIKDRVLSMEGSSESLNEEIAQINIEIDKKELEADELFSLNQDFQSILSEHERLSHEMKVRNDQVERLKSSIELLNSSDEELLHMQQNFESITRDKEKEVESAQNELDKRIQNRKELTESYNRLIRLDGVLRSKEADYNENVEKIRALLDENSKNLSFEKFGSSIEDFNAYRASLLDLRTSQELQLNELSSSIKKDNSHLQASLQEVLDSIVKSEQQQEFLTSDLSNKSNKADKLKATVDKAGSAFENLESLRSDLEATRAKLLSKKEKNEITALEKQIEDDNFNLSKLEFEVDELSKKISSSNRQSEIRTKVDMQKSIFQKLQNQLNRSMEKIREPYSSEIGSAFELSNCKEKYEQEQVRLKDKNFECIKLHKEVDSELGVHNSLQSLKMKEIDDIESELSGLKSEILNSIEENEIPDYESVVHDLEENYKNVLEDINTFEVTRQFNTTAIKFANDQKQCLLCKRDFDTPGLNKFLKELKSSVNLEKIREIEEQAEDIKKDLSNVKSINPHIVTYRETSKKLLKLRNEVDELSPKIDQIQGKKQTIHQETEELQRKIEKLDKLGPEISDIIRINRETNSAQYSFEELSEELNDFGSVPLSISELQKLQQSKNHSIKGIRSSIRDKEDLKQSLQREATKLEGKIKDIQLSISKEEHFISDLKNQKATYIELQSSIDDLRAKLQTIEETLCRLREQKSIKNAELEGSRSRGEFQLKAVQQDLNESNLSIQKFDSMYLVIEEFEKIGRAKLEKNSASVDDTKRKLDEVGNDIEDYQASIKKYEKSLHESSKEKHNISANLDYRGLLKEIMDTEERLQELDIESAHAKREEFQQKSKHLRSEITSLRSNHDSKSGELKQIGDQIKKLKEELKSEYNNVNANYHEEWIKLQTNMLVSNDIQTYSKALDNAIMKYHSIKMGDINRILKELWSQTYKGSDIETIAIKSDVNIQSKGNRSYNYRVVMYKSGNELDMRGRCSAGQKVLTSILIRLALAECFGTNCGIIALDEPTTNLDQENSESLAEALNQIIEFRKAQSNFQLIVITHDEHFLNHINGGRFTDIFYRVQRDEQQSSRIYSLPISKIQDS